LLKVNYAKPALNGPVLLFCIFKNICIEPKWPARRHAGRF